MDTEQYMLSRVEAPIWFKAQYAGEQCVICRQYVDPGEIVAEADGEGGLVHEGCFAAQYERD